MEKLKSVFYKNASQEAAFLHGALALTLAVIADKAFAMYTGSSANLENFLPYYAAGIAVTVRNIKDRDNLIAGIKGELAGGIAPLAMVLAGI